MKAILVKDMRALDCWAIETIGIPQAVLMENAGRLVAEQILKEFRNAKSVLVVVYKGNNGGDGLVAARYLANAGLSVTVCLLCLEQDFKNAPESNLNILKKLKVPVLEIKSLSALRKTLGKTDLIVDAIFGVGLKGRPKGLVARAIGLINKSKKEVVAVDVPSGLDADTGKGSLAIQANLTVTFHAPKKGLLNPKAVPKVGRLVVADIGIPLKKRQRAKAEVSTSDLNLVRKLLPKRKVTAHKGDCGRVLVVAGSKNMPGASALVGKGALRVGAGLVYVAVPEEIRGTVFSLGPELMVRDLSEVKKLISKVDALALGPGITTEPEIKQFVFKLLDFIAKKTKTLRLVLDADALNIIAGKPSVLGKLGKNVIVTPHPGEMSRLTGLSNKKVQENRIAVASDFAERYGITVILKGAYTVIAQKGRQVSVNLSGNPGMATAGSGDVLTGIVAGLLGQGLKPYAAALAGAYIHGLAGDFAKQVKGEAGLIASDIVEAVPYVLKFILYR